jgi:predicted TIM-barrel fold metal-dependent hydrolase
MCPETRFIVDHCGNPDPKSFNPKLAPNAARDHAADQWKKDIEAFAQHDNVICKISGIIARLPSGGTAADLAPIVDHCLDTFGPDRVVFGSDWPVCLLGGTLQSWVEMLRQIVSSRTADEQRKLWSQNALRHYNLST